MVLALGQHLSDQHIRINPVRQQAEHNQTSGKVNVQKPNLGRIKTIAIYAFALVGAFKIATLALQHLSGNARLSSAGGELFVKALSSPSGKYKAIVFTNAGGGASSPSCFQRISVAPAFLKESDIERMPKHEVYSGPCDSFANHEPSPKVQWTNDSSLRIEFPINATAISPSQVYLKKSDASNSVAVSFLAHE